jgi:anaerobic selenocysteine-containing dehydrogenase
MDEIHECLASIVNRWGPGSVALYYGTGANMNTLAHSAMKAWMAGLGSPYLFSSMTLDQSAKWVTMGRMGCYLGGQPNFHDADVLMMVGSNPAVSHASLLFPTSNPLKWVREARDAGLKLIVVDPRQTETAREADIHVRVRPGEDAALFAGLLHIVLDSGLEDRQFCERFVGPVDTLRSAVSVFTPGYVSARTGVPVDTLVETATVFAKAARKSAASGTGPNMASDSNVAEHLIAALNAICGGYRRAGDKAWNTGALYASRRAFATVLPPARTWERGDKLRSADIGPIAGEYPTALLPAELLHSGDDRIRALVVVGGDPVRALPDPALVLRALDQLELLVTLDHRPTDTGAKSHYEIATSLPYERHDLTGVLDSYFHRPFAQGVEPIVERPAGIIDDWEFFWGLARRSGTPMRMKQAMFGVPYEDIPGGVLELDPTTPTSTEDVVRWMSGLGPLSWDELLVNPHGIAPEADELVLAVADDGARLDVCPPDVAAEIAAIRASSPDIDDRFPLRLIVRRTRGAMNGAFRKANKVTRHMPHNPVYLSPQVMIELGLEDGATVTIESDSGSLMAHARADGSMSPDTVAITHAWGPLTGDQGEKGSNVNLLMSLSTDLQPINFMPRLTAVPVRILAVDPQTAADIKR